MPLMSKSDAAYLAGLVDGEGTVTLSRIHKRQMRYLVVAVCNNEQAILQWIVTATSMGHITGKRQSLPTHAKNFTWRVSSRRALAVLREITPFMRGYKRWRAILALDCYLAVTPRNGKYNPQILNARSTFESRFFSITATSPQDANQLIAAQEWPKPSSPPAHTML